MQMVMHIPFSDFLKSEQVGIAGSDGLIRVKFRINLVRGMEIGCRPMEILACIYEFHSLPLRDSYVIRLKPVIGHAYHNLGKSRGIGC